MSGSINFNHYNRQLTNGSLQIIENALHPFPIRPHTPTSFMAIYLPTSSVHAPNSLYMLCANSYMFHLCWIYSGELISESILSYHAARTSPFSRSIPSMLT